MHLQTLLAGILGLGLAATSVRADALAQGDPKVRIQPVTPLAARAFPLADVHVLAGPFQQARDLDEKYLLSLEVDRLLHNFRVNAGLPSTAQPLGGWEEPKGELRGHFVGHYLSACALMYASTADPRFKARGDAVVAGLAECQAKMGSGYLSAFPESFIDRVEKRIPVWAPYYTLHKILAGLLDMYVYCDNTQALEMARRFGDWAIARNSKLSEPQMQSMLDTEHGGMNEALANLYALTGEEKYLKVSLRFNHQRVIDPASHQEDRLTGLHANTQIPKFIGTARQYELSGDASLKAASLFFWQDVVKDRSYVIGGHSDGEMFSPKERLSQALGPNTTETCNTYNMLKLTRHLFCWEPRVEYADYYERALYNHILASQHPETGMMCYYVPLRTGSRRNYNEPNDSFWCCTGTGVENHAKYADSIYFHSDNDLYVNLFIDSELNWKAKGLRLRQETQFPQVGSTKLVFTCNPPVSMNLRLRHPFWASAGFQVRVNGESIANPGEPGQWVNLERRWKTGDTVEVAMPFNLRVEGFKDNPKRVAFLSGPLVLAAEVTGRAPFPAMVGDLDQVLAHFEPLAGKPNNYRSPPGLFRLPGQPKGLEVTLEPFYGIYGQRRYEVYWDQFSPQEWSAKETEYEAAAAQQRALESRTVDVVMPGEEQDERDHHQDGQATWTRTFEDRSFRFANTNGWFSWTLKVLPKVPQELRVSYGAGGRGPSGLDLYVNERKLASEQFTGGRQPSPTIKVYPLPPDLIEGKEQITVKFQAPDGARGASVFETRTLRPAAAP